MFLSPQLCALTWVLTFTLVTSLLNTVAVMLVVVPLSFSVLIML